MGGRGEPSGHLTGFGLVGIEPRLSEWVIDLSLCRVARLRGNLGPFRLGTLTVICEALALMFDVCGLTTRVLRVCYLSEIMLSPEPFDWDYIHESGDVDLW